MTMTLNYKTEAAAGYDAAFAQVTSYFAPSLLRAAAVTQGMHVLDIATGTGLVAEAALAEVGAAGSVTAADLSPAMIRQARRRLSQAENVAIAIENGEELSFLDQSFDAVLCSLGLMFFPNPELGLAEFHRVLRPGGRAAVSVNTVPQRSYNTRINLAIARYVPSLAETAARVFSLGNESRLRSLFTAAGFVDIEINVRSKVFQLPSFDVYFTPFEQGAGSPGQALVSLPEEARRAVREEVRRELRDDGGPIELEVEYMFASGRR